MSLPHFLCALARSCVLCAYLRILYHTRGGLCKGKRTRYRAADRGRCRLPALPRRAAGRAAAAPARQRVRSCGQGIGRRRCAALIGPGRRSGAAAAGKSKPGLPIKGKPGLIGAQKRPVFMASGVCIGQNFGSSRPASGGLYSLSVCAAASKSVAGLNRSFAG